MFHEYWPFYPRVIYWLSMFELPKRLKSYHSRLGQAAPSCKMAVFLHFPVFGILVLRSICICVFLFVFVLVNLCQPDVAKMWRGGGGLEPESGLVVSKEGCHGMEGPNMDQICIRLIT